MSGGPNEFTKRALTGAVYVALTLGAAIAGPWTTFMLFLPVCVMAAREWHRLFHGEGETGQGELLTMALAALVYISLATEPLLGQWDLREALAVITMALLLLAFFMMRGGAKEPARVFAGHLGTILYVACPFAMVSTLMTLGHQVFIAFMVLLWTNDTGAYLVGRAVGRTKLMPAVSPGKTWEGLLGGAALTMFVAWWLARSRWTGPVDMDTAVICGGLVAVTATLGDLLESAFKRARGVKDSGTILPGHGGILDRFDGFLLAAPTMVLAIRVLN